MDQSAVNSIFKTLKAGAVVLLGMVFVLVLALVFSIPLAYKAGFDQGQEQPHTVDPE